MHVMHGEAVGIGGAVAPVVALAYALSAAVLLVSRNLNQFRFRMAAEARRFNLQPQNAGLQIQSDRREVASNSERPTSGHFVRADQ
jgi:hypothetical protein